MRRASVAFKVLIIFGFTMVAVSSNPALAQDREAAHEQLIQLRSSVTEALNSKNPEKLKPFLHDDFVFTTVDSTIIRSVDDFEAYLDKLFNGPESDLSDIEFNPTSSVRTDFIANDVGVNYGTSQDKYTFKNGTVKEMTSNWTATVIKDGEVWKVASIHMSVNVLDNPVLDIYKNKSIVNFFLNLFKGGNK